MSNLHSPFVGLVPYNAESSRYFCGRDREVQLVTANAVTKRLSVFYGPSGSGKSSVLCAGVIPEIQQNERSRRIVVLLRQEWATDPLGAVNEQIRKGLGCEGLSFPNSWLPTKEENEDSVEALEAAMPPKSRTSSPTVWQKLSSSIWSDAAVPTENRPSCVPQLILLLDQFEDLFVQCPAVVSTPPARMLELSIAMQEGSLPPDLDPGVRFAAALIALLNQPSASVNVVFSLREDCLADLDVFKGLLPGLFDTLLRIDQLERSSVEEIITESLRRWSADTRSKCSARPELIAAILNDDSLWVRRRARAVTTVRYETPFLQLTLERLWLRDALGDQRDSEQPDTVVLHEDTFTSFGKALGIRRTFVDETLEQKLSGSTERRWFIESSRYLVSPTQKIPWIVSELLAAIEPALRKARTVVPDLSQLVALFSDLEKARLMREVQLAEAIVEGDARFEMAHDSLAGPVVRWREREDVKLNEALKADQSAELRKQEEERSVERRRIHDEAAKAAEQRVSDAVIEAKSFRRRLTGYKVLAWFLAAVTLIAMVLVIVFTISAGEALAEREVAIASAKSARADAEDAIANAEVARANELQRRSELAAAEMRFSAENWALKGQLDELNSKLRAVSESLESDATFAVSRDALLSASDAVQKTLSNTTATIEQTTANLDPLTTVSGKVLKWDVTDPNRTGDRLALITGWDQAERLGVFKHDASRQEIPTVGDLDPETNFIAARWDYGVTPKEWLLGTRVVVRNLRTGETVEAQPVDWGPGDSTGAVMHLSPAVFESLGLTPDDEAEYSIEKSRPPLIAVLASHSEPVNSAVFATGRNLVTGDLIATAGKDKAVVVWDANGQKLATTDASESRGGVSTLAFVPGRDFIITGSLGQSVRLLEYRDNELREVAQQSSIDTVIHVEFAPFGKELGLICRSNSCSLFNIPLTDPPSTWLNPGNVIGNLPGAGSSLSWASFSANGEFVVTSSAPGRVGIYSSTPPFTPVITRPAANPAELNSPVRRAVFSPRVDERVVASGLGDKVMLWRAEEGESVRVLDQTWGRSFFHVGGVPAVAFNNDGRLMASIGTDGQCILWNVVPNEPVPLRLVPHDLQGRLLAVGWKGEHLALGGEDGGLEIWSIASLREFGEGETPELIVSRRFAAQAHNGVTGGLTFSPNGLKLLTWSGVVEPTSISTPKSIAATWSTKTSLARSDNTAALWDVLAAVNSGKTTRSPVKRDDGGSRPMLLAGLKEGSTRVLPGLQGVYVWVGKISRNENGSVPFKVFSASKEPAASYFASDLESALKEDAMKEIASGTLTTDKRIEFSINGKSIRLNLTSLTSGLWRNDRVDLVWEE